ncbi:hypothetical protein HELRODRAFT_184434 [Helobdella robusta]|uniref:Uncharacterized protein n=1 Tax=Helobdella robusta TaxID=6412 RepID=T1FL72_HELRO|nr:hypothetical protein HELRODRAFT_184434 [Helobdella robusta]ESN97137.1 hypothetical protein HELRODRAFT_184434 [Helobdella robusta]
MVITPEALMDGQNMTIDISGSYYMGGSASPNTIMIFNGEDPIGSFKADFNSDSKLTSFYISTTLPADYKATNNFNNYKKLWWLVAVPLFMRCPKHVLKAKQVSSFKYLGSLITSGSKCDVDIKGKAMANDAYSKIKNILTNSKIKKGKL